MTTKKPRPKAPKRTAEERALHNASRRNVHLPPYWWAALDEQRMRHHDGNMSAMIRDLTYERLDADLQRIINVAEATE